MAHDLNPETQTQCPYQPEAAEPDRSATELGARAVYQAASIGPYSPLRKYTDGRLALTGSTAGLMQLAHPQLGAGVTEHSDFFNEPIPRIMRSTPRIIGVATSPNGEALGRAIRDEHKNIKGIDAHGCPYHALNPHTFMWAHATFYKMVQQVPHRFSRNELTLAQEEQLYVDSLEWGRRYGVSMRYVPPTYGAFNIYWDDMLANQLEKTEAFTRALNIAQRAPEQLFPSLPKAVTWAAKIALLPIGETVRLVTIGGLPDVIRDRFEIPWSGFDQRRLRGLEIAVSNLWPRLPARVRYPAQSRADYRAAVHAEQQGLAA